MLFLSGFAGVKSELPMYYKIIKDTADASVDPGKCLITGTVLHEGEVVANALVYSQNARAVKTNVNGEFRILVDTVDQYVTISKGDELQSYIEYHQFKGGHWIDCEVYLKSINEILIVDKPVIYMYSDQPLNATVELQTEMSLTFTYPILSATNKWEVEIQAEGLFTANGQSFPYLFWEAETTDLTYNKNEGQLAGDIVRTDTIISYLENTLQAYGLNSTEQTDFITYWGPRMVQYNYVVTQFNVDDWVEEMAALTVSPAPDAKRRLFMLFTGFENQPFIEVLPQPVVSPFERTGFTLLEWGGTEVSKAKLYKTL